MSSILSMRTLAVSDSAAPAPRPERPATVLPLRLTAEAEWQLRTLLASSPDVTGQLDGHDSEELAFLRTRFEVAETAFEEAYRLLEQCEAERDALKLRVAQLETARA